MKITSVELAPVRTPRRTGTISVHIVLKVHTDEGLVGIGEISDLDCYRVHLPDLHALKVAIEHLVVGHSPFRQAEFHQRAYAHMPWYLRQANTYPPFQLASQIAAGIDMALYDLVGKALDTPVYNLLGGKVRDRLEMTYPIFAQSSDSGIAEAIEMVDSLVSVGVTRFRYYVGVDFDSDERFLSQLRTRFGQSIHLKGLDFGSRFYWKDALRLYERLEPYGFDLIEGVSWQEDYDGMAEVRRRVPVAVSEHVSSYAQALRMIRSNAVDVFNISHQSGGLWGAARLFALSEGAGVQCLISTTQELSVGTAAVAHLGATIPDLQYPGDAAGPLLYMEDIVQQPVRYDGISLVVPDGPGLGMALDEEALERLHGSLIEWDAPAHGAKYVAE